MPASCRRYARHVPGFHKGKQLLSAEVEENVPNLSPSVTLIMSQRTSEPEGCVRKSLGFLSDPMSKDLRAKILCGSYHTLLCLVYVRITCYGVYMCIGLACSDSIIGSL